MRGGVCLVAAALLSGCASTTIETTGTALAEPFCRTGASAVPTVVTWGAQWRPDQKEPALREEAAARGLDALLAGSECIAVGGVERFVGSPPSRDLCARPLPAPSAERAVLVVVRELGGGAFVVKGVASLDQDLASALRAALRLDPPVR